MYQLTWKNISGLSLEEQYTLMRRRGSLISNNTSFMGHYYDSVMAVNLHLLNATLERWLYHLVRELYLSPSRIHGLKGEPS